MWVHLKSMLSRRGGPRKASGSGIGRHRGAPPLPIDVEASDVDCRRLFDRVVRKWTRLGAERPHWSVLTHESYEPRNIADNEDTFFESGRDAPALVEAFFCRNGQRLDRGLTCLEFGSGVARLTIHLARLFQRIIAVDVSRPHQDLAASYLAAHGASNVSLVTVSRLEDLANLPPFHVLFSWLVFQHNPPPLSARMLRALLEQLQDGGYCLVQVATYLDGYEFRTERYLVGETDDEIEGHVLPQRAVFRIFRDAHVDVIEACEDDSIGQSRYQSMIFFGRKQVPAFMAAGEATGNVGRRGRGAESVDE
jgi:SAM-dependent methyltransferase